MKVTMLKNEPGGDLAPGERFRKGEEYDVPDQVGRKWIRRMIAVASVAPALATNDKSQRPRRAGRDTTEE